MNENRRRKSNEETKKEYDMSNDETKWRKSNDETKWRKNNKETKRLRRLSNDETKEDEQ